MRKRPIIFTELMLKALLAGQKTQTRRKVKPAPQLVNQGPDKELEYWQWNDCAWTALKPHCPIGDCNLAINECPYGSPDDLLWVRESWAIEERYDGVRQRDLPANNKLKVWYPSDTAKPGWAGKRRRAMFMMRWASRLTLEITRIRIEQVHGISLYDVQAEGLDVSRLAKSGARDEYGKLWESISSAASWAENPWVWVIEFKVHHCNIDKLITTVGAP